MVCLSPMLLLGISGCTIRLGDKTLPDGAGLTVGPGRHDRLVGRDGTVARYLSVLKMASGIAIRSAGYLW